ncbi:HDOD domain-containing protein [Denitratisoma oestradiolicum]|uniref:Uncharacterized protein n=1 Tax=Denitratisoma oestradiolicum TaxID=311182 RepID=A0A6S6Y025_9PROT|nr:HDOD domain-containing protein [Denitratisoma oestradiolicum]TWO81336.1 hypothetical protein CBW56_04280 [Denitratisoma oestradiolicum]CAB1368529.1 conserved protein of unknown function [Denitratisoma oestradiolicum]
MLTSYQMHWGVEQWSAFLKIEDIPIMPASRQFILAIAEEKGEDVSPRELAVIVTSDPFLALRVLRAAEARRSRVLGRDATTPIASIMQTGLDRLMEIVDSSPLCDDSLPGLTECESRCAMASFIARSWASCRSDISPDEVALAALLAEIGEMMLWHFAPEIPQKALEELRSGRAFRTLQAQQQAAGFSFKLLSLALADAWELPHLLTMLIRGADNARANIARLANDTARHIQTNPENPAIPSDIIGIRELVPSASYRTLITPLPISDEFREVVLDAITRTTQ